MSKLFDTNPVCTIWGKENSEFVGSGIILSSRHVLTCLHVVKKRNPFTGKELNELREQIFIRDETTQSIMSAKIEQISSELDDLALLTLTESVLSQSPAVFVSNISTFKTMERLIWQYECGAQGFIDENENESPELTIPKSYWETPLNMSNYSTDSPNACPRKIRCDCSFLSGCSGGAVLIRRGSEMFCIGIVQLGSRPGTRAPISEFCTSDSVLSWLSEWGISPKVQDVSGLTSDSMETIPAVNTTSSSGATSIFISYSHQQSEWVLDRLVPVLEAGGTEVLVDPEPRDASTKPSPATEKLQDKADGQILVFSSSYMTSELCRHEMNRAIGKGVCGIQQSVLPIRIEDIALPKEVMKAYPFYIDFYGGLKNATAPWQQLMTFANADLGTSAPYWLEVRDDIRMYLRRNQSVNLVVKKRGIKWRPLLNNLRSIYDPKGTIATLAEVNMDAGGTETRRGLVQAILKTLGHSSTIPPKTTDLGMLHNRISEGPLCHLMLKHFDRVQHRKYGHDLFSAFRALSTEERNLVLLLQSYAPLKSLLPEGVWESSPVDIINVEIGEVP